jgi:uncharacterized protein (TIGR02246 family)
MYARTFLPATFALAVLVAGCTPAKPPAAPDTRDADAKAIRQIEADGSQAFAARDADKTASFYADDASLFLSGRPAITGRDNIANAFKPFVADKNLSFTLSPDKVVVSKSGDLAYTQGSTTFTYTDPKTKKAVLEKGKYVQVFMKQADGSWKVVADIDNADGPPTPVK